MKWITFFMALFALCMAADERKVRDEFALVRARLDSVEGRKCTLMAVTTPTGVASICAIQ